jgi:branched-subunit amino acid transport protein
MIRVEILLLILGMTLVTDLPRLAPFIFLRAERIPERWRSLLRHIPHAALGALLIPGCISGVAGNPVASIAGILAAGLVLWFKPNILLAMLAAVAAALPFVKG